MEELANPILQAIEKEVTLSKFLIEILEKQKQALENHDIALIEEATAKQEPLISAIQKLHETRFTLLKENGFEASFIGLQKFIKKLPAHHQPQLNAQWQELREIRHQLERLIYINKNIIDLSHTQVNRVLEVLYDQEQDTTYGPDASTHKSTAGRPRSQI